MNKGRVASRMRIQFVGLLMLLGMGALGLRLWWIQVAHGNEWTSQLRGSSQATVRIPSVRGEIKDRNGVTLVQNRAQSGGHPLARNDSLLAASFHRGRDPTVFIGGQ